MKAIIVLFDSLSKEFLPPYGNDWVKTPNFNELADRSITFDNCYVGSMPCMPARREIHTGRYNFLHRAWGPLEPFDDSMPEILSKHGVYTHLVSDHLHYWEDGGATYHNRYSSWELARGQEGDTWKGQVKDPEMPDHYGSASRQDEVNRKYMQAEKDMSQTKTFDLGLEFIEQNHAEDNWLLQIECFDPHPPCMAPEKYQALYPDDYDGPRFDWPSYDRVGEDIPPEAIKHCKKQYAALVSMCDHSLGRVCEAMDRHGLWEDTMVIVTADHGFMLGEHGWWAFVKPPFYSEAANKPLFIWDPETRKKGERNNALVQTHDIPPTLLEYFGINIPSDMQGISLKQTLAENAEIHDGALFGVFGGHVNCTDGRYVYMRAPVSEANEPLYNYTLMPTHMRKFFSLEELQTGELAPPFSFTKGCCPVKYKGQPFMQKAYAFGNLLFDLEIDPRQEHPLDNPAVEEHMRSLMIKLMQENDAPDEQYQRLGLIET